MEAKKLLSILREDGWEVKDQKGSHIHLTHAIKKGKVTLPMHSGDIARGTLNAILKQAGLK